MRVVLACACLVAVALAGCAEGSAADGPEENEQVFEELGGEATSTTGLIRGVVFDATITPIEGAKIAIQSKGVETSSNADGAFVIDELEPGTYFLDVSKTGYKTIQTSASVEAGVKRPEIVRVQLAIDEASRPIIEPFDYAGYLQCGVGLGAVGASTNPCALVDSVNTFDTPVQRPVNFTQIEMHWDGTNVFGDGLDVGILRPGTLGNFVGSDGPSPRVLPVPQERMESGLGDDYDSYLIRVFPGTNQPVSVVLEQEFQIFAFNFYGMVPSEGWSFIEHGEHPVP